MNSAALEKTLDDLSRELDEPFVNNFDPVRFAFVRSLATRASRPQHIRNARLDEKARSSIQRYLADLDEYRHRANKTINEFGTHFPGQTNAVKKLFEQCKFEQLEQSLQGLKLQGRCQQPGHVKSLAALRDLTNRVNQQSEYNGNLEPTLSFDEILYQQEQRERLASEYNPIENNKHSDGRIELHSIKKIRQSIKDIKVDKTINRAINEAPENPGPHNPQMLAIKSLTNMRDLSPHYSRRFAVYIETLLWLEKSAAKLSK